MTARQLIAEALLELGVGTPGQALEAAIAAQGLSKLNRIIDNWNAEREAIYADQWLTFTLTRSLQPHTIGPTGATWTTAQRPVSIENAQLIVGDVTYPITLRLAAWWAGQSDPTLSDDLPTDLYYDATWPNGSLYFWPVPSASYDVQLLVRAVLTDYTLDTVVNLPPGYRDALTLTLAEECAASMGMMAEPSTVMSASKARARIFTNNTITPPLATRDSGIPGGRGWFNWRTGIVQ